MQHFPIGRSLRLVVRQRSRGEGLESPVKFSLACSLGKPGVWGGIVRFPDQSINIFHNDVRSLSGRRRSPTSVGITVAFAIFS